MEPTTKIPASVELSSTANNVLADKRGETGCSQYQRTECEEKNEIFSYNW